MSCTRDEIYAAIEALREVVTPDDPSLLAHVVEVVRQAREHALVLDEVIRERNRLRDLLDAETGRRGLEGWVHHRDSLGGRWWQRGYLRVTCDRRGRWKAADFGGVVIARDLEYALEAMEAADGGGE